MDADGLEAAMRLGDRCPLDQRSAGDLGRFGLGLKTASFSQCRRLTVASVRDEQMACLRWDLDDAVKPGPRMASPGGAGDRIDTSYRTPACCGEGGTLVLWERIDRIVTRGFTEQGLPRCDR